MRDLSRDYVLTQEAARTAGVSPTTMRGWVDSKQIRSIRGPGGVRFISRTSLEQFIRARQPPGLITEPKPETAASRR